MQSVIKVNYGPQVYNIQNSKGFSLSIISSKVTATLQNQAKRLYLQDKTSFLANQPTVHIGGDSREGGAFGAKQKCSKCWIILCKKFFIDMLPFNFFILRWVGKNWSATIWLRRAFLLRYYCFCVLFLPVCSCEI